MRDLDEGYCSVMLKAHGATVRCPREEYARLVSEWQSAVTFINVTSIDGVNAVILRSAIDLIEDLSSEALATWQARQRAEALRDAVEGT